MFDKFIADAIKKRVAGALGLFALAGLALLLFWRLGWLPGGGTTLGYELLSIFSVGLIAFFALMYLLLGLSGAAQTTGIMTAFFLCLWLFETRGLIVALALFLAYALCKKLYTNSKAKKALLTGDPDLDDDAATEILRSLDDTNVNIYDVFDTASRYLLDAGMLMATTHTAGCNNKRKEFGILHFDGKRVLCYPTRSEEDFSRDAQRIADGLAPETEALFLFESILTIVIGKTLTGAYTLTIVTKQLSQMFKCEKVDGFALKDLAASTGAEVSLAPGVKLKAAKPPIPSDVDIAKEVKSLDPDTLARRRRARLLARVMNGAALLLSCGFLFLQQSPELALALTAILLLLPPLAWLVYIKYSGLLRVDSNREGKPNLVGATLLPELVLLIMPATYTDTFGFGTGAWFAVLGSAIAGLAAHFLLLSPHLKANGERKGTRILIAVFNAIYGIGLVGNILVWIQMF